MDSEVQQIKIFTPDYYAWQRFFYRIWYRWGRDDLCGATHETQRCDYVENKLETFWCHRLKKGCLYHVDSRDSTLYGPLYERASNELMQLE
jgi:hypothetical protein